MSYLSVSALSAVRGVATGYRCGGDGQAGQVELLDNHAPGGSTGSNAWHSWVVLRSGDIYSTMSSIYSRCVNHRCVNHLESLSLN